MLLQDVVFKGRKIARFAEVEDGVFGKKIEKYVFHQRAVNISGA